MKATDKVYVKKEKNNVVYSLSVQHDNGGEEYLSKDALISFLEKEKDDLYNWHFHDEDRKFKVYEEVIDKIKEL